MNSPRSLPTTSSATICAMKSVLELLPRAVEAGTASAASASLGARLASAPSPDVRAVERSREEILTRPEVRACATTLQCGNERCRGGRGNAARHPCRASQAMRIAARAGRWHRRRRPKRVKNSGVLSQAPDGRCTKRDRLIGVRRDQPHRADRDQRPIMKMHWQPTDSEVISLAEGGLEIQEEYFHSRQELHTVLRQWGFDARSANRPVRVERRRPTTVVPPR